MTHIFLFFFFTANLTIPVYCASAIEYQTLTRPTVTRRPGGKEWKELTFGILKVARISRGIYFTNVFLNTLDFCSDEEVGRFIFLCVECQHFLQLTFTVNENRG